MYNPNYHYVNGKVYDLRSFQHPGGSTMLRLGQGRDCTMIFTTYHLNKSLSESVLARYCVEDEVCPPLPSKHAKDDPLFEELRVMVNEYKKVHGSKIKTEHAGLAFVFFVILVMSYYQAVVYGNAWAAVLVGVVQMLLGLQLTHDGLHGAVSHIPFVNFLSGLTSLPFVYAPVPWLIQHDVQHHVYTNEIRDVDIHHLRPYLRVSPLLKHNFFNNFNMLWLLVEAVC